MKLTNKQRNELKVWEHFMPKTIKWSPRTDDDVVRFFEWSEQGKHRQVNYGDFSHFNGLREGKRWAGIHMQMYEEGVLDGSMPYVVILEGQPEEVIHFMKKEMFKGVDAGLIDSIPES